MPPPKLLTLLVNSKAKLAGEGSWNAILSGDGNWFGLLSSSRTLSIYDWRRSISAHIFSFEEARSFSFWTPIGQRSGQLLTVVTKDAIIFSSNFSSNVSPSVCTIENHAGPITVNLSGGCSQLPLAQLLANPLIRSAQPLLSAPPSGTGEGGGVVVFDCLFSDSHHELLCIQPVSITKVRGNFFTTDGTSSTAFSSYVLVKGFLIATTIDGILYLWRVSSEERLPVYRFSLNDVLSRGDAGYSIGSIQLSSDAATLFLQNGQTELISLNLNQYFASVLSSSTSSSSAWYEYESFTLSASVTASAKTEQRAALLSVNGFTRKYTPIGISSLAAANPITNSAPATPQRVTPSPRPSAANVSGVSSTPMCQFVRFGSAVKSIRCSDSVIVAETDIDTRQSGSSSSRFQFVDRKSFELIPLNTSEELKSLVSLSSLCLLHQSIDSKWQYFLTSEGVRVLLVGFNLQDLLHNLILFESRNLADEVCAMNLIDAKQLRLASVKLGLEYRQPNVIEPALAALSTEQRMTAAAMLSQHMLAHSAKILDMQLLNRLFTLTSRFLADVMREKSEQILRMASSQSSSTDLLTFTDSQHEKSDSLPIVADPSSPTIAELQSELNFLMRAAEDLREEWRVSLSRDKYSNSSLGDSMKSVRPSNTFASPFASTPMSPLSDSGVVSAAAMYRRSNSTLGATSAVTPVRRLRRGMLFGDGASDDIDSVPPTASEIFSQPLSISPVILPRGSLGSQAASIVSNSPAIQNGAESSSSSSSLRQTVSAPVALPELAQLIPRGVLERWERMDDYDVIKDGLMRGKSVLLMAFLRTRDIDLNGLQILGSRLVYTILSQLQIDAAAELLFQLGRDIGSHLLFLALRTYKPLLRHNLLAYLQQQSMLPASITSILNFAGELEKCYPATSYHTEHQNRSKSRKALQVQLSVTAQSRNPMSTAETWQTGDISDVMRMSSDPAIARLEAAGGGAFLKRQASSYNNVPLSGYAQFSLEELRSWSASTKYRVLLDAPSSSPSATDLAALKSFEAHLLYLQSHFNLRAMSQFLHSEKLLPKDSEGEVLSALDRTFLRSSFVSQFATELLATRGALLSSERTDPQKILLRLAQSHQLFTGSRKGAFAETEIFSRAESHFLKVCVENELPQLLEVYFHKASVEEIEAKMTTYRGKSVWFDLWLKFLVQQKQKDLADLSLSTNALLAPSTKANKQTEETLSARIESSGVLERPLVAAATFAFLSASSTTPALSQSQLYSMLRNHNAPLFSLFMETVPFLYHSLQSASLPPPSGLRSARGDVSLSQLLEFSFPSLLIPSEKSTVVSKIPIVSLPSRNSTSQFGLLDLPYFLTSAQPFHAYRFLCEQEGKMTEKEIEQEIRSIALCHYSDSAVIASALVLMHLRGMNDPAQTLAIDLEAIKRILSTGTSSSIESLLPLFLSAEPEGLLQCLSLLEESTRALILADPSKAGGDGSSGVWYLVSRFCFLHALPPSGRRFIDLARSNDWVMFLYESQAHQFPASSLVPLLSHFSPALRSHLEVFLHANPIRVPDAFAGLSITTATTSTPATATTKRSLVALLAQSGSVLSISEALLAYLTRRIDLSTLDRASASSSSSSSSSPPLSSQISFTLRRLCCSKHFSHLETVREAVQLFEGLTSPLLFLVDFCAAVSFPHLNDWTKISELLQKFVSARPVSSKVLTERTDLESFTEELIWDLLLCKRLPNAEQLLLVRAIDPHLSTLFSSSTVSASSSSTSLSLYSSGRIPSSSSTSFGSVNKINAFRKHLQALEILADVMEISLNTSPEVIVETLLQQQDYDRAQQITRLFGLPPEPVALQHMRTMAQRQRGVTARRRLLLWRRIERELLSRGCTEHSVLGRFFEERFREIVGGGPQQQEQSALSSVGVGVLRDEDEMNEFELLVQLALSHYKLANDSAAEQFVNFIPLFQLFRTVFPLPIDLSLLRTAESIERAIDAKLFPENANVASGVEVFDQYIAKLFVENRLETAEFLCKRFNYESADLVVMSTAQSLVTETSQPKSITLPMLLHQILIKRTGQLIENPLQLLPEGEPSQQQSTSSAMSLSDLLFQLRLCISPQCRDALHRLLLVNDIGKALSIPYREVSARSPLELLSLLLHSAEAWNGSSQEKAETRLALVRSFIMMHSLNSANVASLVGRVLFERLERNDNLAISPSQLQMFLQIAQNGKSVGDEVLRLLQSPTHSLPPQKHTEAIIVAHACYVHAADYDAQESIVQHLLTHTLNEFMKAGHHKFLMRLVACIKADLQPVFDALMRDDQFEVILNKNAYSRDQPLEEVRATLLRYLLRNPQCDEQKLQMFYLAFAMYNELGTVFKGRAEANLQSMKELPSSPSSDELLLKTMQQFLDASNYFSKDRLWKQSTRCLHMAKLIALQLKTPSVKLLKLSQAEARNAMLSRPSFEDCATLARAYELDTPTEWAPVIYSHTITATNSTATTSPKRSEGTDFLSEYLLAYPAGYAVVFTELARRYRADPQKAQKAHAMTAALAFVDNLFERYALAADLGLESLCASILNADKGKLAAFLCK